MRRVASQVLDPALRSQGLGTKLTEAFEDAAVELGRSQGAKTVTIDVGRFTNEWWMKALERRGYVMTIKDTATGWEKSWVKTIEL